MRSSSGCGGEAQRRHEISHRERRAEPQPVDARDRHARGMQPRDDQPGKFAAFPHQHHDVARPGLPLAALDERGSHRLVSPRLHLLRDLLRELRSGPDSQLSSSSPSSSIVASSPIAPTGARARHRPGRSSPTCCPAVREAEALMADLRRSPRRRNRAPICAVRKLRPRP